MPERLRVRSEVIFGDRVYWITYSGQPVNNWGIYSWQSALDRANFEAEKLRPLTEVA